MKPRFCGRCEQYEKREVAALGHEWDDGVITTAPTTTSTGVKTYTCTRQGCNETYTETIPKLDGTCEHTWVRYVITQEDSNRASAVNNPGKTSFTMPWGEVNYVTNMAAFIYRHPGWVLYYCSKCHEVN